MKRTVFFLVISCGRTFPTLSIESEPSVSQNPEYGSSSELYCLDACYRSGITLSLVAAREHKRQWAVAVRVLAVLGFIQDMSLSDCRLPVCASAGTGSPHHPHCMIGGFLETHGHAKPREGMSSAGPDPGFARVETHLNAGT